MDTKVLESGGQFAETTKPQPGDLFLFPWEPIPTRSQGRTRRRFLTMWASSSMRALGWEAGLRRAWRSLRRRNFLVGRALSEIPEIQGNQRMIAVRAAVLLRSGLRDGPLTPEGVVRRSDPRQMDGGRRRLRRLPGENARGEGRGPRVRLNPNPQPAVWQLRRSPRLQSPHTGRSRDAACETGSAWPASVKAESLPHRQLFGFVTCEGVNYAQMAFTSPARGYHFAEGAAMFVLARR